MGGEGDWPRLGRHGLSLLPVVLAVGILILNIAFGHTFGYDFRGGTWRAAQAIVHGQNPYPPPRPAFLLAQLTAYIPPPPFALVAVPLALAPWPVAIAAWSLVSVGAFLSGLWLVGLRDWRVYVLAAASFPFVCTLGFGQTEGLLALGIAAAWRWRGTRRGALAVGAVVAAKLIVWPLVVWLLLTRGRQAAGIAVAAAGGLLVLSWGCIDFRGLLAYPRVLAADDRAFADRTHSIAALLMHAGLGRSPAELSGLVAALAVAGVVVRRSGRGDQTLFLAAVGVSLLASPMLEMHYLTLLLIPLALLRPRLDWLWLLVANVFWLSPHEPARAWQIALVLAATGYVLVCATPDAGRRMLFSPRPRTAADAP